jgi:hypothetical protein
MLKSIVCIEEIISQEFEVIHAASEDPLKIADAKYYAGEFGLSPGEVSYKKIAVVNPPERETEWREF